ncbi:LPS export ABC transporter periplasmic protein LptC [Pelagibacterales bacterium SAG-MED22]|nr:LPS export ABC transporter periplasmic protein LptC [Pelagibacterales bacterium SAG-MED22]
MVKKNNFKIILFITLILLSVLLFYFKFFSKKTTIKITEEKNLSTSSLSNVIKDVSYVSTDSKGNKYSINALTAEIDQNNSNILFLTDVSATIELTNSNNIKIISDYGKYNSDNFDTIFSKNVIINYLENKINGEYLDFSIARGNMIISRNVVYSNPENILEADIIDINIETKDTKISMFDKNQKVNLRSKQ